MQITIDLPDNLPLTEADVRLELAIVLYQQHSLSLDRAAQLAVMSVDDFYQLLISRHIVTPPADPDDEAADPPPAVVPGDPFPHLLTARHIVPPPADPDDEPAELVLASLRNSLQQIKEGKLHPIAELWEGIIDRV